MVLAGLVAYGVSQTLNVFIFSKLSGSGEAKRPPGLAPRRWREFLSQVVDTLLFITISSTASARSGT